MILWTIFRNSLPLQLVAIALAGWAALGANNALQRYRGGISVIEKTNAEAEKISAEAIESRKRGDVDDAVAQLRARACRDCLK